MARLWNEELLNAIRHDFARPTVHARNLYHASAAMWDAWAAYEPEADGVYFYDKLAADDVAAARDEAVSYAAYRVLSHRYRDSAGGADNENGHYFGYPLYESVDCNRVHDSRAHSRRGRIVGRLRQEFRRRLGSRRTGQSHDQHRRALRHRRM